jgi:hypothetical protein
MDDNELVEDNCIVMKPFSEVTKFHGHVCPGSAIGYKAAETALNELKSDSSQDEEIVAIVEIIAVQLTLFKFLLDAHLVKEICCLKTMENRFTHLLTEPPMRA